MHWVDCLQRWCYGPNCDSSKFIYWSPNLSVQFSHTVVSNSLQPPWTAEHQASLSITNSWSLPKLTSFESVMPSKHLCHRLLLLPSIFPSTRVFSNESVLRIRWPKYWSFSISISSSSEYSELISFRIDWFDVLAVQGTQKSLLQYHSLKASILRHSAFFMVQLFLHDYWKNHSFDYMDLCQQSNVSGYFPTNSLLVTKEN